MDRKQRMNDLINELVTKKTTNNIITELGNRLNWIKV